MILYYDCFAGISGDMNLGALVDLGVDFAFLQAELGKLAVADEFVINCEKRTKNGIVGTKISVSAACDHTDDHAHSRSFSVITQMITGSALSDGVKKRAIAIFTALAQAEAKVHNHAIEAVHFHEVGAIDAIVDIVGAAICLEKLGASRIYASRVEVGGGFVKCAHGTLPVPAPATIELLKNAPVAAGLTDSELTTPTGAAILAASVDRFLPRAAFTPIGVGYGFGDREFDFPNALRVYLADDIQAVTTNELLIETNIDDMSPETLAYAEERLYAAGALDIYKTAITTKKNRLGVKLSVLLPSALEREITALIFAETSSIGVKKIALEKTAMKREIFAVETEFGSVSVKRSTDGKTVKYKPEFEDCRRVAKASGKRLCEVTQAIQKEIECIENTRS